MPTKTAVAMTPDRVGNRPLKMRDLQTAISFGQCRAHERPAHATSCQYEQTKLRLTQKLLNTPPDAAEVPCVSVGAAVIDPVCEGKIHSLRNTATREIRVTIQHITWTTFDVRQHKGGWAALTRYSIGITYGEEARAGYSLCICGFPASGQ